MTRSRIYLFFCLLSTFVLSCILPSNPMFDESAFNTSVAKTVSVGLTQNYVSPTFTLEPTQTFIPSPTSNLPTFTFTPTETITPTFPFTPTASETPEIPLPELSVTVNTNCRSGAGRDFEVQGSLLVGETAKVYGIDPSGQYWYIANPDPGSAYCWISGRFAVVDGAVSLLPVFTPPPTSTATFTPLPPPDFRMTYSNMDGCGNWQPEIIIYNSGLATFKSGSYTITDAYWGETATSRRNGFVNFDKCEKKAEAQTLPPESGVIITAPGLTHDPTGKRVTFTATLCTEPNFTGDCLTRTLNFRP